MRRMGWWCAARRVWMFGCLDATSQSGFQDRCEEAASRRGGLSFDLGLYLSSSTLGSQATETRQNLLAFGLWRTRRE